MNRAQRRQRDNLTRQLRAHITEHGIEAMLDKMFARAVGVTTPANSCGSCLMPRTPAPVAPTTVCAPMATGSRPVWVRSTRNDGDHNPSHHRGPPSLL